MKSNFVVGDFITIVEGKCEATNAKHGIVTDIMPNGYGVQVNDHAGKRIVFVQKGGIRKDGKD